MIRKTYDVIGPLFREQRMPARKNTPEVQQALTRETLREKASTPNALKDLKALINAEGTTRTQRIQRAQEAVRIAEQATEAQMAIAEKKSVLAASREVLQEAMEQIGEEIRTETTESTKTSLRQEQNHIEQYQKELQEIETQLEALAKKPAIAATTSEFNWKSLATQMGAALVGGALAKWLWEHTIGWVWDSTVGNKEKPGVLRKLGSVLAGLAGAVGGILGLQWLSKKMNWNLFSKAKELWDTYGIDKATYYAGLALYKVGKVDEARKVWGANADRIIVDLEAEERGKRSGEKETKVDENGIEWMRVSDAIPNYTSAIHDALNPLRRFLVKNKEGLLTIAGVSLVISPEVRQVVLGGTRMGKDGVLTLLKFFGGTIKNHPILSALSFAGILYGLNEAKDAWVPKDPASLQEFASGRLTATGMAMQNVDNTLLAKIPQADWNLLGGLMVGTPEARTELQAKTEELLQTISESTLERAALSPPEMVENKNEMGLKVFLGFLEAIKIEHPELQTQFDTVRTYIEQLQYPLTLQHIEELKKLSKDFDVLIEEEGGIYVYRIQDEQGVWHTRTLCINPAIPLDEQASYARTFIVDRNDPTESLNQFAAPVHQAREWMHYVFFKDAKTEEEAAQKLQAELNGGGTIIVRSGIAFLCTVSEGVVKKYAIGPYEFTVKPLWKYVTGDFSCTELVLDYTEGILPVFVLGTLSAISRLKFAEILNGTVLMRSLAYPVTGTVRTSKLIGKSIITPMYQNIMRGETWYKGVLEDPAKIIISGTRERIFRWKGLVQRKILPGRAMSKIGFLNRRISYLHEAKKLIGLSRYNLRDTAYLQAAREALIQSEMSGHAVPGVAQLAEQNGTRLIDEEILRLEAEKRAIIDASKSGRAAETTADTAKITVAEIKAALANADEMTRLLKNGTPLTELLNQAASPDDYARIAAALKGLDQAERIKQLQGACAVHSIESLQSLGLADSMDDLAKAVAQLGDDATRVARLKELLMLGMKQEQLLAAGAQTDEVARAVKAVASATDDTVRGSGKMGTVTAAVHGQSTPATGTSTLPKPAPAAAAATSGDDAARVAHESVAALENGALLKHAPTRLLLERNPEEAARVLQIAQKANGIAGAKRAARYMLALADDVDASRRAAMFSPEVLELVAKGDSGNPAAIARFLGRVPAKAGTELTSDALANAIKQMTRWQRAGTAMRTLYVAGAAVEVGMVAWDTYNLVDAVGERKKQREALGEALRKAGLTSADGETYTGCGVEVSLTEVEDTDVEEYAARVAVGAGALGFTLLAPSLCLGPVGLVVAGVVIAAHVTIGGVTNAFEQRKHQEFLMKAPHWLLTMLGTQTTIRQSEHQTMREYTGVMSQDIWPSSWTELALAAVPIAGPAMLSIEKSMTAGDVETTRKNLREKLLQSISFRALAHGYPELLTELPGMQEGLKSFMDPAGEFLRAGGDYERIVRPYIVLRLHGHTEGEGVAFRQTNLLDLTDNKGGWFDGSWLGMEVPTVDQYDLERAVEEAMLFYVHHMREKRYRAAAKHLETLAGEEEKRLATQTTLTESQRAEKLHSYREALQTALAEEVEENKDMFYVLNRKPSDLPTYPDGRTFTEHMLEERFRHVESTSADTSARAASTGWRSPASGTEMNIGSFAEVYLRPAFREQDGTWLKKNSPPRGEPFSFDELNVEMGMTDEEFAATFRQKIAPAQEVDKALTRVMDTEEDMKACVENLGEKIDFHQKLHRYRGYYNTYLRRWRPNLNMHIPEGPPLAKTLKTWRDRGYPRLIPQEFFAQWRTRAKNRSTALPENTLPILQQGRQALRLPQMEGVAMQFHIPGLDLSKEGTRVYSYDGYWTEMQRVTTGLAYEQDGNIFTEILLRQQTGGAYPFLAFRNASALNRYRPTPDPFAVWRRMQVERNDRNRTRAFDIRPREEPEPASQMYIDASGKPRPLIEYTQKKDVVAVTPMELEQLLRELGILAQPMPIISPRPSMQRIELLPPVYDDEFKPLREYLVRSRILVTVDPMPTQQQLPLHLLR